MLIKLKNIQPHKIWFTLKKQRKDTQLIFNFLVYRKLGGGGCSGPLDFAARGVDVKASIIVWPDSISRDQVLKS